MTCLRRVMTKRLETGLECLKDLLLGQIGKLLAKALEITEGPLVNDADEAEEFKERVLQWRCREQQFAASVSANFSVLAMTLDGL